MKTRKATSSKDSSTWTVIVPSVHTGSSVLMLCWSYFRFSLSLTLNRRKHYDVTSAQGNFMKPPYCLCLPHNFRLTSLSQKCHLELKNWAMNGIKSVLSFQASSNLAHDNSMKCIDLFWVSHTTLTSSLRQNLACIYHYHLNSLSQRKKMSTHKARWIYGGKWAPYGSFVHHMALTALPPFSLRWLGNFLAYAYFVLLWHIIYPSLYWIISTM